MDTKDRLIASLFRFRKIGASFPGSLIKNLEELDVSMAELALMKEIASNTLNSEKNVGVADIQNVLFITKAAVSQMYASLEKKGYLNREIDKNNRRKLIATLTPKGQNTLAKMESKMNELLSEIVTRVGEDNTKQMIELINLFADVTEELKEETF